ncbi:glycine cleavage system protein GcvH [Candidatus Aciduliprofundum boonei]|uniref:Probable glycine cleavage system H protein n=1 Tax=Aciduliprofundum boonei (strain DSM 19572 / T469) TaxID=439481 RepID=B5ICQ4_ACIB4|nr:glycine cleavage system protein GcvH [Candidatus Aciduliprofundum boonei]ADD09136.1 glycine cleavage system H protein [Aciduliprofundum boonei T469]EDY36035.1 glycine cleavage system H protein [Aciduliprofundum boonei T469]HII55388.1 glycine cleavage system protein GcvH [Candidatus Aciduliprofundum boonei]
MIPEDLKYTKTHEWVKVEGNKAKIGITYHAQEQLHDIVYVELPNVGDEIAKGDNLGVVESVKAASDIYAPISGKVVAVNDEVVNSPELLNQDPYKNWLVEMEITNPSELDELLSAEEYKKVVEEES